MKEWVTQTYVHGKRKVMVDIRDSNTTWSSMHSLLPREWIDGDVIVDAYYHVSDHACLLLALYLAQSPLNRVRHQLMQEARKLQVACVFFFFWFANHFVAL
ncbi:hypothetical protein WN944_026808 [Citrus x changshan-huyou]|uniref:Uncharacterized protein n=1 Tax=Citrus x changshan-huyou TaxID=2935761 RepID=A0AAP0LKP1_9ROSI